MQVPFNNLKNLSPKAASEIKIAVERVLDSGWFILGPEVEAFETAFAAFHDISSCVTVANGTDAIELALRAAGIQPGDEVITVSHTAVPTVCAIERAGATPVLIDIDADTYTMDPAAVENAIGPRTRAIVPVHLYGHPARIDQLCDIASAHGLFLLEDCAQAHGTRYQDRLVGTWGDAAAFSFYPTKNLGAYGDGGAIITRDAALAERIRRIRNYGQTTRYYHQERGVNSRLDELQAAILCVKLKYLDEHNDFRRTVAEWYASHLTGVALPMQVGPIRHAYHLYVVRHPQRDGIRDELKMRGIDTQIHYPIPIHLQEAYLDLGYAKGSLPITERVASEIFSLPMNPGLDESQIRFIGDALRSILEEGRPTWQISATHAA